jgi:hypothetical protein
MCFSVIPRYIYAFVFILCIFPPRVHAVFDIFDYGECANAVNTTYFKNPKSVTLIGQNGQPTNNYLDAWGVTYEACRTFCVGNASFINWNSFSTQLSSWLLPWLALTAQLPFETKSTFSNFQVLFLAIGCPLLIIYSLSLTMLNARSINDEFREVKEEVESLKQDKQTEAVKAARVLLIESQNVPIQVVNGPGRELAQLVVDPKNWTWWPAAKDEILKTKRGWTYSLIAQLGLVVVSQLLSIVDYFTSKADEDTISVGLGINSVWVWMIPVTLGWVLVGTQTSAGSIKAALKSVFVPKLGEERNVWGKSVGFMDRTKYGTSKQHQSARPKSSLRTEASGHAHPQESFPEEEGMILQERLKTGSLLTISEPRNLSPNPSVLDDHSNTLAGSQDNTRAGSKNNSENTTQDPQDENHGMGRDPEAQIRSPQRKSFFGFDIAGDDEKPGPIFNYARVWSHMNAVKHVVDAFRFSIHQQNRKYTVKGSKVEPWNLDDYDSNLSGTPEQMSQYISEDNRDVEDLSVHSSPLPVVRLNCVIATVVAFFLFWGTTGAGFLIAYE